MALATRCPACSTVFRISTAQATAKGGTVRCGQCRHVFDSLDALVRVEDLEVIEEVQVAPNAASDHDAPSTPHAAAEPEFDAATRSESGGIDDGSRPDARALAGPEEPAADDHSSAAHPASENPPIVGDWWLPDPADSVAMPLVSDSSVSVPPSTNQRDDASRRQSGRGDDPRDLQPIGIDGSAGPAFLAVEPTTRLGRAARRTLGIGSLVASIALVGQLAYLLRDEIAARWTATRPWLTAACVPLRCSVGYPAHLEWITIESATIQTTGASLDVYVLNALLRNRASADVRYPHLELVLTDLQDRPILRRALRPEDYLPAGRSAGRNTAGRVDDAAQTGFAADSELPIHLTFELGDLRFAGYRVDMFYP